MAEDNTLEKVTAFITRTAGTATELLVFYHEHSGVQVPAGTVEVGETPEQAVLREIDEETGLRSVRLMRKLGIQVQELSQSESALWQTTPFFAQPLSEGREPVGEFKRAHWVTIHHVSGNWSQVSEDNYDLDVNPPLLLERVMGWVPSQCLATRVVRHFFHIACLEETSDRWERDQVEGQYLFRLYWAPLVPLPRLLGEQNGWLKSTYGQLLESIQNIG